MEFVIAGVGLALAVWMILGARNRNRSRRDHPADRAGEGPTQGTPDRADGDRPDRGA